MGKESALEKIRKLEAEKEALMEGAKQEALDKANLAIRELNELGFSYKLVQGAGVKIAKRTPSDKLCPHCKFKTNPPHDGRAHRSQEEKKRFTNAELQELGYTKVE